jgi:hypothetical protein
LQHKSPLQAEISQLREQNNTIVSGFAMI